MDWFEKIKSMNYEELAKFLVEFDANEITNDYCDNACNERSENGQCKHKVCVAEDSMIIEKWLHLFADEE